MCVSIHPLGIFGKPREFERSGTIRSMELLKPTPDLPEISDNMTEKELVAALEAGTTVMKHMRRKSADVASRFNVEIGELERRRDELTADFDLKEQATEAYLKHLMKLSGARTWEGVDGKVTLRATKAVDWDSSVKPPAEFTRIKRELNKKDLNAAIKRGELMVTDDGKVVNEDGEMLPGITIVHGDSLGVKTKY